jgi:murein DD-endopeptidase MepM/ murein hydrolase activator NlpD
MSYRMLAAFVILAGIYTVPVAATPVVLVTVTPAALAQGGAVVVTLRGAAPDGTLRVRFASRTWPLYQISDRWQTYLGTDPNTYAGLRPLVVELVQPEETLVLAHRSVTVRPVTFPRRHITFAPSTAALLDANLAAEEQAKLAAALQVLEATPLWTGSFLVPVIGPITSGYGVFSFYQGIAQGWHHGVDIAAPEGQVVSAANAGIIRLAEMLPLSGITVVVDHGMGILTYYMHMSAVDVVSGQRVGKGDLVGRVGSTGLATGPHLHWGVRVNGIYVDPLRWPPDVEVNRGKVPGPGS